MNPSHEISAIFNRLRFDKATHLGEGAIRLDCEVQNEILELLDRNEPVKKRGWFKTLLREWLAVNEIERLICDKNLAVQRMLNAENESRVANDCYSSNLGELAKRDALIRDLRFRLSEIGRAERQRKVRLP